MEAEPVQRRDWSALDGRQDSPDAGRAAVAQRGRHGGRVPAASLAGRLRIKATKGAVAALERIAIDGERVSTQADIDNLAARLAFVPEFGLEQNAQRLVGLQRQAQVGEAADELDRFADDRVRHPVADAGAIDAVGDREVRPDTLVPEGIVEQLRRDDRLGGLLVPAVVLRRDGDDILAVFEDRDLLDPVCARQIQRAHGHRHALGRQRLDVGWRVLRGAFDHARAVRIEAVGDQEIADRVRHQRLEDGFLELWLPARSAEVDLKLVAVRGRQKLALSVSRRFGAAVIVGTVSGSVCAAAICAEFIANCAASASASCPAS